MLLTLNMSAATINSEVEATGTGYIANTSYPVMFSGNPVTIKSVSIGHLPDDKTYIRTDGNGSFRFKANLPNSPKGTQQPFRVGANHAVATISITERVSLQAMPDNSLIGIEEGESFAVNGSGFSPNDTLALALRITSGANPNYFYTQSGGTRNEATPRVTFRSNTSAGCRRRYLGQKWQR